MLKELMARLGHSSVRAAMIYQHATRDRDQAIAKAFGTLSARYTAPRTSQQRNRNAGRKAHEPGVRVARVWHAGPADGPARCNRTSKNSPDLGRSPGAGDGNRTRITSLEVRSPGLVGDLCERRCRPSAGECP